MDFRITNINQQNFNGSFLVKFPKSNPKLQIEFERSIDPNKFQRIKDVFAEQGNFLYVVREAADISVARFLDAHKRSFRGVKYFPQVSTSDIQGVRINEYFTEKKPLCIEQISKILEHVNKNLERHVVKVNHTVRNIEKRQYNDNIQNIIRKFGIQVIEKSYLSKKCITKIRGTQGSELLISPQTEKGYYYIFHRPKSGYGETEYLLVDKYGDKIYNFDTPDKYKNFIKQFEETIEAFKIKLAKENNN